MKNTHLITPCTEEEKENPAFFHKWTDDDIEMMKIARFVLDKQLKGRELTEEEKTEISGKVEQEYKGQYQKKGWTDRELALIEKYEGLYQEWDKITPVNRKTVILSRYAYAVSVEEGKQNGILMGGKRIVSGGYPLEVTINYYGREGRKEYVNLDKRVNFIAPNGSYIHQFDKDVIRKNNLKVVNEEELPEYFKIGMYHIYDWVEKKQYHIYQNGYVRIEKGFECKDVEFD